MEKQFKLDIHVHTSETSSCGQVSAQEAVRLYEQAGYDGIIITDHYHREYFNSLGNLTWNDKIDCYLKGYRTAKSEAAKGKMKVFLGIEYRNVESDNDYLVFGMDESMLFKEPELYSRSIQDAFACFRQYGAIILQAHPFRKRFEKDKGDFVRYSSMDYPELLDGFEFYNGNKNWIQDPAETKALQRSIRISYWCPDLISTIQAILQPEGLFLTETLIRYRRLRRLSVIMK